MPHRHPETPDRECICLTPPRPPAKTQLIDVYPVEYRYMVQEHPAARHSRQPNAWICPQCLANRIMSHGAVVIFSVIHADPLNPRPTCADCETREAAEARVKAKLNPAPEAMQREHDEREATERMYQEWTTRYPNERHIKED